MSTSHASHENLLKMIKQLYNERCHTCGKVASGSVDNKDYLSVKEELEATLHELNVYQEELYTQSEDLRNTVEELNSLYRKYVHLFDFAPIGYFTFDARGLIKEANLTGADLLGYERGHLLDKPMLPFVARETRDAFLSHLRGVFSGLHGSVEVELVRRNGERLPFVIESTPIKDNDGNIIFCRSAALDIRDRKRAEQALKAANDQLEERVRERTTELVQMNKSLQCEIERRKTAEKELSQEKEILDITLRGIGDGIITTETTGRIILMNEVAERLTGWKAKDAQGRGLSEVFNVIDESTRATKKNPIDHVFATGRISGLCNHTILKQRSGPERIIENSGLPIKDNDGKIVGAVLVIRDVTEERSLEEERRRANKLESIGFLAGGIAHDFNNLLTAIFGNISLANMVNEKRIPEIDDILGKAETACDKAKALTGQLLTFAKGGKPVKKVHDIRSMIRESSEFMASGAGAQLNFDIADDLHLTEVDEGQLNQVISNLVINAIQATAKKKNQNITVRAKNFFNARMGKIPLKRGKYVHISVTDNGHGIKRENIEKIFDPYYTTKQFSSQKGCGLGLSSTYSIIKNHGGHITVSSVYRQGTTFDVYLPASKKPAAPSRDASSGKRQVANQPSAKRTGRILVMDDEEILRDLSVEYLSLLGYSVETASDGNEALQVYEKASSEQKPFDAVIMDLTIPGGMGGQEAIKKLRRLDPDARAIVSSGYSNNPVMAEYESFGFDAVIAKPFRIDDLKDVIGNVLSMSPSQVQRKPLPAEEPESVEA